MRKFFAVAMGSAVALVGFAGAASASATIDLLWATNGTDTADISLLPESNAFVMRVILTAGPGGSQGAGVSVDYGSVSGLSVLSFLSTEGGALPILLGTTSDTGTRVQNINSGALPPYVGTGLTAEGQSHQLGTVTFTKGPLGNGTFEIRTDANGPTDGVLNLAGANISASTTFNSAFLVNVPEPGAISLLVMGLGGMLLAGRGRRS